MSSLLLHDPEPELWPITVDWDLDFSQPATTKALAYWQSLRGSRVMPSRRELSPRAMVDYLSHVNLVEVVYDRDRAFDFVISLQGAHAQEVFGDLSGRRLGAVLTGALEERWRRCFDLPCRSAIAVRLLTRASTGGKNWLACEALVAPLGDDTGSVQALFWVFSAWRAD